MCFSATASFTTAGITAMAGAVAMRQVRKPAELALASIPLFFAVQQGVEGRLWQLLSETPDGAIESRLVVVFLIFAKVLWPVLVPAAALLIEPSRRQQRLMTICLAMGVVVAIYFVWSVLSHPVAALVGSHHVVYTGEPEAPWPIQVAYFIAVGLTAGLSTMLALRILAAIVFVGSVVSYIFYWEAFSSVWCFFAAGASAVIVFHFIQVRQSRPAAIGS